MAIITKNSPRKTNGTLEILADRDWESGLVRRRVRFM